jgi:hypothetical protein
MMKADPDRTLTPESTGAIFHREAPTIPMTAQDACVVLRHSLDCETYLPEPPRDTNTVIPDHVIWAVCIAQVLTSDDPAAEKLRSDLKRWFIKRLDPTDPINPEAA